MAVLLAVIIFLLCLYYFSLRFSYAGRLMAKLPGARSYPVIDHLLTFVLPPDQMFQMFRETHRVHSRISKMQAFGIRYVNIYDPDDVETILSSPRFNDKEVPYTFLRPWLGDGLLISNGEKWQQRRKLLTPAFHFNILKKFSQTFIEQTDILLKEVRHEVGAERTDLIPLISKATLSVMCETSMGTSLHEEISSASKTYFSSIHFISQCFVYRMVRVWAYIDFLFNISPIAFKLKTALQEAHRFTDQVIDERRKQKKKLEKEGEIVITDVLNENDVFARKSRWAMLDLLLENEKEGVIDGVGIREEVDTFMFEGHDTTAGALCFAIMSIANEPLVQKLLNEEMQRIFGDSQRSPTQEDLAEMKYLECCIKETLRLYPSVPMISRFLQKEVILSGYKIPPGTKLVIQVYDIHRRADLYPDPDMFKPERFSLENSLKRHRYAYVPFSAGPRNCIGQKFAMLEMKTVLSGLLRRFCLEPVTTPQDLVFTVDLTLKTNHPIYVRFLEKSNQN